MRLLVLGLVLSACVEEAPDPDEHPTMGAMCEAVADAVTARALECGKEPPPWAALGPCCLDGGYCDWPSPLTWDDMDRCVDNVLTRDCAQTPPGGVACAMPPPGPY